MDAAWAMSRTWMEIDEDKLIGNYLLAKEQCQQGTELIAVLKANAYGLGIHRCGQLLWQQGCRFFAVACADEALALRNALPEADILVMGACRQENCKTLIENNIIISIGSVEEMKNASDAAQKLEKQARVHIKIDTGLHRLGFGQAQDVLKALQYTCVSVEGLFSHLALRSDEQSKEQYDAFVKIENALKEAGYTHLKRHLLDSIGLVEYPDWQMDGVRIGAFLYGNVPPAWEHFDKHQEPVRFLTRVTRVGKIHAGDGVGYDDDPLTEDKMVATLAVGYVDGYPRLHSAKGEVLLHGKRAKVLGIVCMDQMMVDVTDIPDVKAGDVAVLLGDGITLVEYGAWSKMNRNECLAVIGPRVPRVYVKDGNMTCVRAGFEG